MRAVELKLKRMSPGERESAMDIDDAGGYVLVRPLVAALAKFEQSEPNMRALFPDLIAPIDLAAEQKRIASIKFAPRGAQTDSTDTGSDRAPRAADHHSE